MKPCCLVLTVVLLAAGCREGLPSPGSSGRSTGPAAAPAEARMAQDADRQAPAAAPIQAGEQPEGAGVAPAPAVPVPARRKVVRNGSLDLEVPALDSALQAIRAETVASGGYVTNESQNRDDVGARQGSVTCRIPAEKLDATVQKVQALGRVESLAIQAEDITEQYFNLEIRLRNQQQLEDRLLKLLDRPVNKVADLLDVEREVARVRGEIDELEGRRRFWDGQMTLSTLTVTLREPPPVIAGGGGGVFRTLQQALRDAGENIVTTIAWFVAAAGVALPAWLVLWVLWRAARRLRSRRSTGVR